MPILRGKEMERAFLCARIERMLEEGNSISSVAKRATAGHSGMARAVHNSGERREQGK